MRANRPMPARAHSNAAGGPAARSPGVAALAAALALAGCTDGGDGTDGDASDATVGDTAAGDDTSTDGDGSADGGAAQDVPTEPARPGCTNAGTDGATAGCLVPTREPAYYVEQALAYFDTLDIDASRDSIPAYDAQVIRWEWPPWLLLTGLGRDEMLQTSNLLRSLDPSTVPERDCRFFDVQPFARCYIVFEYEGKPCPIYEEFVFDDAGEMTFIEAWSDLPGMLPQDRERDMWAEAADYPRLSTRIPGLGRPDGGLDLESTWMAAAAGSDPEVADFVSRAGEWWAAWFEALRSADQDFFARGCGW